ncbi:phage head completion protein [Actinokineospora iranica]|uniref:Phage head-tail joining protein n=1 Tax=Actinokineospora iranica TaxID=1271860 RepID=A0A1G6K4F9_9PSEU|nr:head-tail adaptor protein [Actinokineospora iranica]SDC25731.1 Phage head-tail joining protein [Actinokineospora iranica]
MQFPHELTVITPVEVPDDYGNPTPRLDYGPTAPRRVVWANVQPVGSSEPAAPARTPVVTRWRVFTFDPIGARERVQWRGRVFEVDGEPDVWAPRFGRAHHELTLRHVEG